MGTDQNRLRSEAVPDAKRAARVNQNRIAASQRRTASEAKIRAELLRELGRTPTASELLLIDGGAIAGVEIKERSSMYLRCIADDTDLERLSTARTQLVRILTLLGLPRRSDDGGAPGVEDLSALVARYSGKGEEAAE
jgi:hypothetical protein